MSSEESQKATDIEQVLRLGQRVQRLILEAAMRGHAVTVTEDAGKCRGPDCLGSDGVRWETWEPTGEVVITILIGSRRLPVIMVPRPEGGFSTFAATLPGAVGQGKTETAALMSVAEAIGATLLLHRDKGVPVPWRSAADCPQRCEPGAVLRFVNVVMPKEVPQAQ